MWNRRKKISTTIISTLELSSVSPEGLPLADPDFRQPGPIDLTLGVQVYSLVLTGELLELGPSRPLAQGTRLGYVITGFLDKETSSDILVEDRGDLAEPTSHQLKNKKYLSLVAESPHTIDVPNDQVQRGHNFSPHGNVNFIAKGSVRQRQEGMNDLNHTHEPQQLKEKSSSVNDLLGAFYTIRPRADRHHALIESTPQWGKECSYPKILNMTTPNKSSVAKLGTVPGAQ